MHDSDKNSQKAGNASLQEQIVSDSSAHENALVQADAPVANMEAPSQKPAEHNTKEEVKAVVGHGQLLRAERLKRGLSVGEVARRLRLSVQQVNAIEEEDYSKLPSGVFLRGFVRNYGSLLQLDTNSLLRLLTQSAPVLVQQHPAKQEKTVPLVLSKRGGEGRGAWLLAIGLVLALLGYGVYQEGDWGQERDLIIKHDIDANAAVDLQTENDQATMELLLPQTPSAPARGAGMLEFSEKSPLEIDSAPVTPPVGEPIVSETMGGSEKTLHFIFSKDSWVEIKDSNKKVIFVKTNAKGTEQVITGNPPLYLVIGNASGVNLTYNGKLVDLTPYTRKGDDVARFSLE